LNKNVVC